MRRGTYALSHEPHHPHPLKQIIKFLSNSSTGKPSTTVRTSPPDCEATEMAPHHQDSSETVTQADEADPNTRTSTRAGCLWPNLVFKQAKKDLLRQQEEWIAHKAPRTAPPQDAPLASQDPVMIDEHAWAGQITGPRVGEGRRKITNSIYYGTGFKSKSKLLNHVCADTCKRGT
ncbi:hypothetical protein CONLIGDRAFT_465570 [Coniochaeta ligniaria NRRL 30616]|uniref:Uncharacterized protein n=1 Tax=Coniochaeta ligniaria NRRL 30616 TaxID=1408157 RepID=A0A1J7I3M0_9PEZI|nr:hypothetical protein CONLIGDRAFT_465570 [Coniochaeta ligniaria NRRL 30616]